MIITLLIFKLGSCLAEVDVVWQHTSDVAPGRDVERA